MNASFKNILCIRVDNMGDVIMSSPAFFALKNTFNCRLTLLTSSAGNTISKLIDCIDETIIADVPWVKLNSVSTGKNMLVLAEKLRQQKFDAAFIFTVYSQSSLPAAMLAYLANIPRRIAYCRENPYELLTTWLPDKEPYSYIQHQVERDLALVKSIGAVTINKNLQLRFDESIFSTFKKKLTAKNILLEDRFIIIHPGVSEEKREYPAELWKILLDKLSRETSTQIIITGTDADKKIINNIKPEQQNIISLAGLLSVEELINLVKKALVVCCVNTVISHIAAAAKTPVIVLYALTNPQHTPWCEKKTILYFPVDELLQSRNEIVRFVSKNLMPQVKDFPSPETVVENVLNYIS